MNGQSTVFRFRCDPLIRDALKDVAHDQRLSSSAYVRRALVQSLRADGAIISAEKVALTVEAA